MNYKQLIVVSLTALFAYTSFAAANAWNEADYPAEYSAKDIRGRIVDANTGEPIEGAVVVAQWILRDIMRGRKDVSDRLETLEAVTDKEGRFYIAEWGPKERPPMTYLENRDPEIWIFKVGYKALSLLNAKKEFLEEVYKVNIEVSDSDKLDDLIRSITSEKKIPTGAMRESLWNGKTIKLHKPKNEDEYWWAISYFQEGINWSYYYDKPTGWKKIKNAVLEIEKAMKTVPKKYLAILSTLPDDAKKIIYGEDKR